MALGLAQSVRRPDGGRQYLTFASGRYTGGPFSTSIDSMKDFRSLPKGYAGGISTDRIDVLAQILKR